MPFPCRSYAKIMYISPVVCTQLSLPLSPRSSITTPAKRWQKYLHSLIRLQIFFINSLFLINLSIYTCIPPPQTTRSLSLSSLSQERKRGMTQSESRSGESKSIQWREETDGWYKIKKEPLLLSSGLVSSVHPPPQRPTKCTKFLTEFPSDPPPRLSAIFFFLSHNALLQHCQEKVASIETYPILLTHDIMPPLSLLHCSVGQKSVARPRPPPGKNFLPLQSIVCMHNVPRIKLD